MTTIHFHNSDDRFCGSRSQSRQFSFEANKVTCQRCMSNDTLTLTEQAKSYVATL
jgi:hypothetical protein